MRRLFVPALLAASVLPFAASAAVYPEGTIFDNRIRYVNYNPDDVVVVKTKLGLTTVIQFEPGEHLNSPESALAIGDKEAWTVAVRENNIIIKPTDAFPETNINIITNKRAYAFDLVETKKSEDVSFYVRFTYPKNEPKKVEPLAPCSDGKRNFLYFKYGDNELAPSQVWDDGKFTCFQYPNNKPLPAIYKYIPGSDLKEALVNFNVVNDVIVVQTTSNEFRLRFADKVLGIKTDNIDGIPFNFNRTATGQKRSIIKDEQ